MPLTKEALFQTFKTRDGVPIVEVPLTLGVVGT